MTPSLGLAAFAGKNPVGYDAARAVVTVGRTDGATVNFQGERDERGALPRYAPSEQVFRRYNAAELIASAISLRTGGKPQLDPGLFEDAFVLFGYSAPGLYDRQATPISASAPGVDIHAFFLRSLLHSSFIDRLSPWLDHAIAASFALALGLAFHLSRSAVARTLAVIFGVASMPVVGALGYALGYWVGIVEPALAILLALASILGAESVRTGRQRSFLRNAFGYYLSPSVIEKIIENPESLRLGGERRRISVMFTDLEGFTAIAETLDPERLAAVLNEYLSAMSDIIFEEGGTIDKYEGDAIIAFWNAPLEQPDHVQKAVAAAIKCRDRLELLRSRLADPRRSVSAGGNPGRDPGVRGSLPESAPSRPKRAAALSGCASACTREWRSWGTWGRVRGSTTRFSGIRSIWLRGSRE